MDQSDFRGKPSDSTSPRYALAEKKRKENERKEKKRKEKKGHRTNE
jgi:hypothetical protein